MAYMSKEGYDNLVAELHRLEAIERPKASAAIAEARDKGDLSENSEYEAAKEAQAHLEDKINQMKRTIAEAKIVDTSRLSSDAVQILSKVELTNLVTNQKMQYKDFHYHSYRTGTAQQKGWRHGRDQGSTRYYQAPHRQHRYLIRHSITPNHL